MSNPEELDKIPDEEQQEEPDDSEQDEQEDQEEIEIDDDDDDDDDDEEKEQEVLQTTKKNTSAEPSGSVLFDNDELEDSDEEEYEYDEDMFKRIDENKQNYTYLHAESKIINKDELSILTKTVRDDQGFIIDNLHTTIPWITKYEFSKILGQRIKQLNEGNKPYITVDTSIQMDNYNIAEEEIRQKKVPFIIKRPMPNGGCEYWKLEDLEIM